MVFELLKETAGTIIQFPLWWYGTGFVRLVRGAFHAVNDFNLRIGLTVWVRNIFVPLYGQRDAAGRIISFFLRLVNIIIRGLVVLFYALIVVAVVIVWLIVPLLALWRILFS